MQVSVLGALVAAILVCACGPQLPSPAQPKVVGPSITKVETGAWRSTVGISYGGDLVCTGTLVAPRLVITAGHCVTDKQAGRYQVHYGNGDEADFRSKGVAVTRVDASPYYRKDIGGHADVAYLVLDEASEEKIIPVATDLDELRELLTPGKKATVVGFGVRSNETGEAGIKYAGPATIKWQAGNEVWMGDAQGDGCSGDSGGPAFGRLANGEWRVFGVTSRGPTPCGMDKWPGVWGLMHWHLCWIQQSSGESIPGSTLACSNSDSSPPQSGRSLASICQDSDLSPSTKTTLHALKSLYAHSTPSPADRADSVSCSELETWAKEQRYLDLSRTLISDLSPLVHFPQLENLAIEDNTIDDLAPIAELERLRVLHIAWNNISDFSPLARREAAGLHILGRGLQRPHVDFSAQKFEQVCQGLTDADHDSDLANTVRAITHYVNYGEYGSCFTTAEDLRHMRYLDLSKLNIRTLEPLRGAHGVQVLRLGGLKIRDLTPLLEMDNLRLIDIEGATLGDRRPLAQLIERNHLQVVGKARQI